jgi:riboflavin biosynthesis pyrimidine reductase
MLTTQYLLNADRLIWRAVLCAALLLFVWLSPAAAQEPPEEAAAESDTVSADTDAGTEEAETILPDIEALTATIETELAIDPFAALLTRRGPSAVRLSSRQPQLYETTQGDETFVFQVLGQQALIRFLCDPQDETLECDLLNGQRAEEVVLLNATRSPRGDVVYKDLNEQPVLRVTSNGGATLFAHSLQENMPDSAVPFGGKAVLPVIARAGSLKAPPVAFHLVEQRMRQASDLISERHGMLVTFVATGPYGGDQAVLADAVLTAAKGIDMVAADPLGARILRERLKMVQFEPAQEMDLGLQEGVLTVKFNRAADLEGRPSSLMVARYLEEAL